MKNKIKEVYDKSNVYIAPMNSVVTEKEILFFGEQLIRLSATWISLNDQNEEIGKENAKKFLVYFGLE